MNKLYAICAKIVLKSIFNNSKFKVKNPNFIVILCKSL